MSHFTVLVTNTHLKDVEEQLKPFDENLEVPRFKKATKKELIEGERAEIKEYAEGRYAEYLADPEKYEKECSNPNHLRYIKEEFPKKLEFTDEELYKEAIRWYEESDIDENGDVWSEVNPNGKWDWYSTGGRWTGYFMVKEGAVGQLGEPGVFGNEAKGGSADVIRVKDIDWKAMDEAEKDRRAEYWDEQMAEPEDRRFIWTGEKEREEILKMTKEEYVNRPIDHSPFAVLHDGKWYERGEMGWWAIVSNEKDSDQWQKEFRKLIEGLDPEAEVTLMDCHV